jgi:prophage antirepressor-like protein
LLTFVDFIGLLARSTTTRKKMTILQFQKFYEHNIRIIEIDGQPWFVAKDLCTALDIRNSRQALRRLDKSEKMPLSYEKVRACSDDPDTTRLSVVSESGMYSLIFSSRKPAAKEYRKWVCEEVLPSIRKTGRYSLGEEIAPPQSSLAESEAKLTRAQQLALWAQQLANAEQLQLQQQQQRRINPGR